MSYHLYIVRCRDGTLYTGTAADLDKRIATHNAGRGARYTRPRLPVTLVYHEVCADKSEALRREIAVKRLTRAQKLELIRQSRGGE